MPFYQSWCQKVQDLAHTGAAVTVNATRKVRLFTVAPTATGGGTEVTAGGGYATGGAVATFAAATAATPSVSASNADVNWTTMPAVTGIIAVDLRSTDGTPVPIEYATITSKNTNAGDTFTIASGQYTSSLQ